MSHLWLRIEPQFDPRSRPFLSADDECYYGCDYTSGGGFQASDCNSRIMNLKKEAIHKGKQAWRYKERAAAELAAELAGLLPPSAFFTFIPTSKCKSDPAYDGRWDMVWQQLQAMRADLNLLELFVVKQSVPSAHSGNRAGAVEAIEWSGTSLTMVPREIWLIDDVVTEGRHFLHCKQLINAVMPTAKVIGAFWGRTIDPSPFGP
jgi:hypothetical protein